MSFNLLIILLSFASLGNANMNGTGCEKITLSSSSSDVYVKCVGNFTEMKKLKQEVESIPDSIAVFELQNAVLDALPADLFQNVEKPEIRKVVFNNVSMELLGIPELGASPFKSVEYIVESLEVYDCSTLFAWNFSSLAFANLKNIIIEDSELVAITSPFSHWPHLRFIQLTHSSIQWIHANAFERNKNLTICSLAHNRISRISRTIFPKPASKLYSIDLSFNRISWIPDDMFSNMDMLQELKLDFNNLRRASMQLLTPVWNNLTQLWLQGNGIECDSLCWMAETVEKPMFLESSICKTRRKSRFVDESLEQC